MKFYALLTPAYDSHDPPGIRGLYPNERAAVDAATVFYDEDDENRTKWREYRDSVGLTLCNEGGMITYRIEAVEYVSDGLPLDRGANPLICHPGNIWQYRQNRPSLVAADLRRLFGVPYAASMRIMLARGAFKWFGVRRDLIRLKNVWKAEVTETQSEVSRVRNRLTILCNTEGSEPAVQRQKVNAAIRQLHHARGRLSALQECRAAVRALCHGPRWQAPDNDRHAQAWLKGWT